MIRVIPLLVRDLDHIKKFSDKWIGVDYFRREDLKEILVYSSLNNLNASFAAWDKEDLVGIRLTFAPGEWIKRFPKGTTPSSWKVEPQKVAFFKSLFIKEDYQGKGLGKKLSNESLKVLKQMGAKAIVCHSWLESPNDSSRRYLDKMGFEKLKDYPQFWNDLNYECIRCSPKKCACTAVEMIKYL